MVNFKKHLYYYISLLGIGFLGVFIIFQTNYNRSLQLIAAASLVFFYVFWGILHHFVSHDLTTKIVVEYILIGCLGMTIMLFLLSV